jgi:hypothetical protein
MAIFSRNDTLSILSNDSATYKGLDIGNMETHGVANAPAHVFTAWLTDIEIGARCMNCAGIIPLGGGVYRSPRNHAGQMHRACARWVDSFPY